MAEEFEAYDEEMVILLDNMPKGCITETQKETLIEDAKRWGAHYPKIRNYHPIHD